MRLNTAVVIQHMVVAIFCLGNTLLSSAFAQKQVPLPIGDALKVHSFAGFGSSSIALSPDGKWLAYVVNDNSVVATEDKSAWDNTGVPFGATGDDIYISNVESGEVRNLTGNKGENWLPVWSSDGRYLAFLSNRDGTGHAKLWTWNVVTNDMRMLSSVTIKADSLEWAPDNKSVLLTTMPTRSLSPTGGHTVIDNSGRESIDGSTAILYRSNKNVGSKTDPWDLNTYLRDLALINVATGEVHTIEENQRIANFSLSSDGSRVAYTIPKRFEKPGTQRVVFDLAVTDLSTMQRRVLTKDIPLPYDGSQYGWSPDSVTVSYCVRTSQDEVAGDCYVVNSLGGEPRKATNFSQPPVSERRLSGPFWSSSTNFYFIRDGVVWMADARSGVTARELATIPDHRIVRMVTRSNGSLWTSDHGRTAVAIAHDNIGKQDGFFKIDLSTGHVTELLQNGQCYTCANVYMPFTEDQKANMLAYLSEDSQHDIDLWLTDPEFQSKRRITNLNPQFDTYKMGAARLISWLGNDGDHLEGSVLLPSDYQEGKHYPLIVWVYGGGMLSNQFSKFAGGLSGIFNMQLFATRGYALLFPDSPQHEGQPMSDLAKTVLPGVNKLIEMGIADPERIGIMGQSNGGYGTLALIAQTKRFRAAIDLDGMGDLVGSYGQMAKDGSSQGASLEDGQNALGGPPWSVPQRYIENSPIFYLDRIATPLLIIHGGADATVAPFLGDEMFVGLRRLGKEVEYAKYEGEGHSALYWSYPNQQDVCNRMINWFEAHLKAPPKQ